MKTIETDIAVVGGGAAGLAAALTAAELGAKVAVFEKRSITGGAGNMAMGPFAVESRLQRLRKIPLTIEKAFNMFMNHTHWEVDAMLVSEFINRSSGTIDWLEKLGVEFIDVQSHNLGFEFTWHIIKGPSDRREMPGTSKAMVKILTDKGKELGVEFFLRAPAKRILKLGERVSGLVADDDSGEEISANAKAVIITTGGFSDNPEWIKKYTGYEQGRDIFPMRLPGMIGEGIRMAWEAGAAQSKMHMHLGCGHDGIRTFVEVDYAFRQPSLMINMDGNRFMNEEINHTTPFGANALASQKQHCAFLIFDEDTKKHYMDVGLDYPPGNLVADPFMKVPNFDREFKKVLDKGVKDIYVVDSIEELAVKTGVNGENLKKTVRKYNNACDTGRDELFYKADKHLRPIRRPKFYVAKYSLGALGTLGGIKINYKTEAVDNNQNVIPGLYSAGNDANSIYNGTYMFMLPGNTLGFALNSGRMAGENAVQYIKSIK